MNDSRPIQISLNNATVHLAGIAFGPFTFSVNLSERVAILGPSGAGKSTLLKLLARELTPSSGDVLLNGRRLQAWSLSELSRLRAVLPQSHEVAFGLPTELVIALGRVARSPDPQINHIIQRAAQLACASHLLGRRFNTLSGGEKARVQLARVFAQLWDIEHALLLVDEPLAALDPGLQLELMEGLDHFAAERGHAVLAVLHDINHALLGFKRLLLIKDHQLVADVPSTLAAIPKLEALYGIELNTAVGQHGELIIAPMRRKKLPRLWHEPRVASHRRTPLQRHGHAGELRPACLIAALCWAASFYPRRFTGGH